MHAAGSYQESLDERIGPQTQNQRGQASSPQSGDGGPRWRVQSPHGGDGEEGGSQGGGRDPGGWGDGGGLEAN